MVLKALRLTNFKAFGREQRIPLRPITLLYGANSSGKSSVIHALALANHAIDTGELDVVQPKIGGGLIDLGGFRQYVHGRDVERCVRMGFEFDRTSGSERVQPEDSSVGPGRPSDKIASNSPSGLFSIEFRHGVRDAIPYTARDAWLWRPAFSRRRGDSRSTVGVTRFNIESNSQNLLELTRSSSRRGLGLSEESISGLPRELREHSDSIRFRAYGLFPRSKRFAVPDKTWSRSEHMDWMSWLRPRYRPVSFVEREIQQMDYLGPLRSYPPRHFLSSTFRDAYSKAGGGDEWSVVHESEYVRNKVNRWLGDEERMNTPYEVQARMVKTSHGVPLQELVLIDKRASIQVSHLDVGVGVSQVLPVLVAAYDRSTAGRILAIEQPELHLHPALQAELGDVFIESTLGMKRRKRRTLLLETHSEHLILRILRRIRETTDGELPEDKIPVHPDDVAVLYVEPSRDGAVVTEIPITPDGDFEQRWPRGFFPERAKELF